MKRYELKFYLTLQEATYLAKRLKSFLKVDKNASEKDSGYLISSLYFDSINASSSWEKLGGFQKREKFRLRIYGSSWSEGDIIKFEIKRKIGDLIEKKMFHLDIEEANDLINGKMTPFYDNVSDASIISYLKFRTGLYRPSVIIDYHRQAFYTSVNNLRVTLDNDLAISKDFKYFLRSGTQKRTNTIFNQYCILEIKFHYFFPIQYKFLFEGLSCVRSAVSKYVMGLACSRVNSNECDMLSKSPLRVL